MNQISRLILGQDVLPALDSLGVGRHIVAVVARLLKQRGRADSSRRHDTRYDLSFMIWQLGVMGSVSLYEIGEFNIRSVTKAPLP